MSQKTLDDSIIKTIRDEVKNGKTKIQVAEDLGMSYYMIKKLTRDIHLTERIPVELKQKIRNIVF